MAQPITSYMDTPYAKKALTLSSTERGLGAMTMPNPEMTGPDDGGKLSNSYSNPQTEVNARYTNQTLNQNARTAQPQQIADMRGQLQNAMSTEATKKARAQQNLNQTLANLIGDSPTGGQGLRTLNEAIEAPGSTFYNDMAVNRLMNDPTSGMPSLGGMKRMMNA